MAFRLVPFLVSWQRFVRIGVPFLVSSYRLVLASRLCLVGWRSRVGVGVSLLVPLLVPSCLGVPCRRASRVRVVLLCRFCQLVFSCRLVLSCLVLSSLSSCSSRRACRMALGRRGILRRCAVVAGRRGAGGVVWRCDVRGVVSAIRRCRFVWCSVACRERDGRRDAWRDAWRDEERNGGRAVFVSSFWLFPCCHYPACGHRGVLGLSHREII